MAIDSTSAQTIFSDWMSTLHAGNEETHEFILWDNGDLTIEDPLYQFDGNVNREHVRLDLVTAIKLKNFLNSERIAQLIAHLSQ